MSRVLEGKAGGKTVLILLVATGMGAAQSSRTAEEENTIGVFERARRGVVHIKVSEQKTEPFESVTLSQGVGSGFLIDQEGHVLTNYHVVGSSNRIEVHLPSGRVAVARVVGTAPTLDLALLGINLEPGDEIEPLSLGDSDKLEVGQKIIAVGHPLSLHNTLTVGVLSAVGRSLPASPVELQGALLQTDAAINPGSSGGPLLDSISNVIGIATALAPQAQNVGFAVPINLAKRVIPDLIKMGHPYRPSLGIDGTEITPEIGELFGLPRKSGFLVERVAPRSIAERAGIQAGTRIVLLNETAYVLGGDIVIAINGEEVTSAAQIARILLNAHPGQELKVTLFRDGVLEEVSFRLGSMHWQ